MMTAAQKLNFFNWCNKYGIPLVCLAILYIDFARPLAQDHRRYLDASVGQQTEHTKILSRMGDTMEQQASTLKVLSNTTHDKNGLMEQIVKSQSGLLETQETALEILRDIHKRPTGEAQP